MQEMCDRVLLPDETMWSLAEKLQSRDQLTFWDALLIAACLEGGVETLYTEDMQARKVNGPMSSVTLVNPFR